MSGMVRLYEEQQKGIEQIRRQKIAEGQQHPSDTAIANVLVKEALDARKAKEERKKGAKP